MKFNVELFLKTLRSKSAFDYKQLQALDFAVRVAKGEDIPKEGDVYKSTRGVRLIVTKNGFYSLVCLKAFDSQYAGTEGKFVGQKDQNLDTLEHYMKSRHYIKIGRISDVDISKVKPPKKTKGDYHYKVEYRAKWED